MHPTKFKGVKGFRDFGYKIPKPILGRSGWARARALAFAIPINRGSHPIWMSIIHGYENLRVIGAFWSFLDLDKNFQIRMVKYIDWATN
jgi:hypothetical protein